MRVSAEVLPQTIWNQNAQTSEWFAECCLAIKICELSNTKWFGEGDNGVAAGCYGNIQLQSPDRAA